ncbi:C6 transcription factor (UaY), putative [Talaromyces stipitatus ATCC 10500]|uniref:C6 transcription factor (UaY), putative n=1 Tax=Talaromyces stipitatus (strain ATCC 10500 / CBS 375.48 / QM 6759 / NRRL 1006) TaxID=441959 RepID=B8M3A6_TALSN|nr:C6 transcription factor (UaY), putative [Talaromyces stipitatus ATCC 10500]EED22278.1 C6 transcription factor (UaY), putative [Talaromyces stipitatus ATCC 10500]
MLNPPSRPGTSPVSTGIKRSRSPDDSLSIPLHPSAGQRESSKPTSAMSTPSQTSTSTSVPASSFRNVSACNRCRLRKNRCDQRLPRCQTCEKADAKCVGFDPITKREIPRSYVFFLEARVTYLERLLLKNGIEFKPSSAFDGEMEVRGTNQVSEQDAETAASKETKKESKKNEKALEEKKDSKQRDLVSNKSRDPDSKEHLDQLVSNIGMVSVQAMSDSRYLGSTSGISFARLVFAAVKSSVNTSGSEPGSARLTERKSSNSTGSTIRETFFGLQSRPLMQQAAFPDRELADRLVSLYFEHANPQMPILHRGDFLELVNRVYETEESARSSRDLYLLNIVFAIGAGIIFEGRRRSSDDEEDGSNSGNRSSPSHSAKKQKLSGVQFQPEEYHAAAVVHWEAFLSASPMADSTGGGLDELQAYLLLASFALLRPVAPGLWYIVGVAVRLAIDLGLHHEDGTGIDSIGEENVVSPNQPVHPERGRLQYIRDHRRRLWWCVYSFDRLVSTCVGRPFGITDQVITTEFLSILDDRYITKSGFRPPKGDVPSYKHVSYHYLKLRLLQSEIQQVLQYQQARFVRRSGKNSSNHFMHTKLQSPFLERFDSFRSWRRDVHRRLLEWKDSSPTKKETGVQFSLELFELNYYQALIMLYRQTLTVPAALAGDLHPTEDVSSPPSFDLDDREDEDDIYLQIAEAGQKVIKIYRQLHRVRLVNYTYMTTHHLFMAGISFLFAIWHSPVVRSRLTLDDVDFTVLAATSIFSDLIEVCPPAETCRDAFERMSRATVRMGSKGFASQAVGGVSLTAPSKSLASTTGNINRTAAPGVQLAPVQRPQRPPRRPTFDMDLSDLYHSPPSQQAHLNPSPRQRSYQVAPSLAPQPEQYQNNPGYTQAYTSYDQTAQQHQQQYYMAQSPQSAGSSTAPAFTPPTHSEPQQHSLTDMSLDFLDFATNLANNLNQDADMSHADGSSAALDTFAGPFNLNDLQGTGINLGGFGMEADYLRDLTTDGSGYDLMDGYWFGMSGGGNSGI